MREIMSAQRWMQVVIIQPVGRFANNSLSVVTCRHVQEKITFRRPS
jgi:hypothetical protein